MFFSMIKMIKRDDQGATAVEYGLILALVFLGMIGAVTTVGNETISMWDDIAADVQNASKS